MGCRLSLGLPGFAGMQGEGLAAVGGEFGGKFQFFVCIGRLAGKVLLLQSLGGNVIEFFSDALVAVAVEPFDVSPVLCADGVPHGFFTIGSMPDAVAEELAEGVGLAGGIGLGQMLGERVAGKTFGLGQSGEVAKGWVDVDGLDNLVTWTGWGGGLGGFDDEGHTGVHFIVGHLAPAPVIAEFPAIVTPEDDDGVV